MGLNKLISFLFVQSDGTWTAVTLGMSLATQQTGMYECAGVNITKGIRKQAQITILPGAPAGKKISPMYL